MGGVHDNIRTEAVMNELKAQRNQALDMLANANGEIVELRGQLAQAIANIEDIRKRCSPS